MDPLTNDPAALAECRAMRHVRDLIAHEGPLLSEFVASDGARFLALWSDRDERANRWLVFAVRAEHLTWYLGGAETLRDLVLYVAVLTASPRIYLVDIDGALESVAACRLGRLVPEEYLPGTESHYPGAYASVAPPA